MTKLLNRIALLISILMWFFVSFSFLSFIWEMRYMDWWDIFGFLFISILLWFIIKGIFLSKRYISDRLDFFVEWIISRLWDKEIKAVTEKNITDKLIKKDNITPIDKKTEINEEFNTPTTNEPVKLIKEEIKKQKIEKVEIHEDSKLVIYFKWFFKENILAKIWSILVFLWVLFLMSLIWNNIPSMWKIIIWFIIWFTTYFTWVILYKKWNTWESIILLWTWILINFLVILAWKYILDWNVNTTPLLSTWVTFLFLILNTLFWVVTSFVYKSKTLLIFSFIFAYLNPLLIGWSSESPYTLIGYSMIVSIWALVIWIKENDNFLKISAFVLGNLLFLIAPFSTEIWWISKFVFSWILGFLTLWSLYKSNYKNLGAIFIANYVFIILWLIAWSSSSIIWWNLSFVSYLASILFFFWFWVVFFIKKALTSISSIIMFPIIIIMWLIFTWTISFIEISLWIVVLSYLVAFMFLEEILPNFIKYIFFGILWWFIFLTNSFLSFSFNELNIYSVIIITLISFVFIITAYLVSKKKSLEYLYTIWTIGWILTLLPVVNMDLSILIQSSFDSTYQQDLFIDSIRNISIFSIILFALINTIFPFFNKNLVWKNSDIKSLVIWSIIWALFIWLELFRYWMEYFPWTSLWFGFAALAIFYFILGYMFIINVWIKNIKKEDSYKNILYSYLWLSISIFSLSIALIFSSSPEVISLIWLLETTILFFFYKKTNETKMLDAWIILFIIWIVKLLNLESYVKYWELMFLIPFSIIFISFILNIKFIDHLRNSVRKNLHDILHIIWVLILWSLLVKIIPSTGHGWSMLGIASFTAVIWFVYSKFSSNILKWFFVISIWFFTLNQISNFDSTIWRLENDNLNYLIILQYISTIIISGIIIFWNKVNKQKETNIVLNIILSIYLLIIVSIYIYNIIPNTFAITIFWWILSIILLIKWISNDKIKLRTIWLYLLSLVLSKIFLYDLWYWLEDAISRVLALIILWVLLIFVSTRYSKKYWNNLTWEFNLRNLFKESKRNKETKKDEKKEVSPEISSEENTLTSEIKNIDLKWITSASFKIDWKIAFSTKSKNILQVVVYVIQKTKLTQFNPMELNEFYDFITENYKSELNSRDYNTVTNTFKKFVESWWEVILK